MPLTALAIELAALVTAPHASLIPLANALPRSLPQPQPSPSLELIPDSAASPILVDYVLTKLSPLAIPLTYLLDMLAPSAWASASLLNSLSAVSATLLAALVTM